MRILFDTNIILDLLLDREPYSATATGLVNSVHTGKLEGLLGATTLTTIYYLARRAVGAEQAKGHIKDLLRIFDVAPVHRGVLEAALTLPFSDFEDAVQHASAELAAADGIVTRNAADFKQATLAIYTPAELKGILETLR